MYREEEEDFGSNADETGFVVEKLGRAVFWKPKRKLKDGGEEEVVDFFELLVKVKANEIISDKKNSVKVIE